ncbi:MAG: hypothetical protein WD069_08045 [Planctomycetales bacterium]
MTGPHARFAQEHIVEQAHDWKERPTLSVAADLVSVAFTLGLNDVATDAAHFVLRQNFAPLAARSIAAAYLRLCGADVPTEQPETPVDLAMSRHLISNRELVPADRLRMIQVHRLRSEVSDYPRNPIAWSDLAFYYTTLGIADKAEQAMVIAMNLAPYNRYVLRSASRLFLHVGERERALSVLSRSPLVQTDPWILAAEIAIADSVRRASSKHVKRGKRMVDTAQFDDRALSELTSALGTLDYKAGKLRDWKKNIAASLRSPTENAIAQAVWLSRASSVFLAIPKREESAEAAAWTAVERGQWDVSRTETEKWRQDQPFSSRPAIHGSFIAATVFEDFPAAIDIAHAGLRCNPDDSALLNNLSFAAAMSGDLETAEEYLKRLGSQSLTGPAEITFLATQGLLLFRKGCYHLGREFYVNAVGKARSLRDSGRETGALAYFAMEEVRAKSEHAQQMCDAAIQKARALASPFGDVLVEMVNRRREADAGVPGGR